MRACDYCHADTESDGYICWPDAGRLLVIADGLPDLVDELMVSASRQRGVDYRALAERRGSTGERPSVIDDDALTLAGQITDALRLWHVPATAELVRARPDAADCLTALVDAERRATARLEGKGPRLDPDATTDRDPDRVRDYRGTATSVSRLLAGVGVTVPATTIRSWAHRRLLGGGPDRYRAGDVLELAEHQPCDTPA